MAVHDHIDAEEEDQREDDLDSILYQFAVHTASVSILHRHLVRLLAQQDADAGRDHKQHGDFAKRIEATEGDQYAGYHVWRAEIQGHLSQIVFGKRRQRLALTIVSHEAAKNCPKRDYGNHSECALHQASLLPSDSS